MQDYPGKTYADYLRSPHWQQTRKQKMDHCLQRCRICKSKRDLVVHHRDYECLGKENIDTDLVILCGKCHHDVHFTEDGTKLLLTRSVLVRREMYLYERQKSLKYRLMTIRPSDIFRAMAPGIKTFFVTIYKVSKLAW